MLLAAAVLQRPGEWGKTADSANLFLSHAISRHMQPDTCSAAYDSFAEIYNRWMAADFCRRMWPVVEHLLLSLLPAGAHILDVCCGTGQMAQALCGSGYRVTGVDASGEMLRLARNNARRAEFILADACSFSLPCALQGAISTFNSLAHLNTATELRAAFGSVRAALVPDGPFLFDLNMEAAYTSKWRGQYRFELNESVCTVRPEYDRERRIGCNWITLDCGGERTQFSIEQKCHTEEELRSALLASGFHRIETFDAQHDLGIADEQGRTFFLCS